MNIPIDIAAKTATELVDVYKARCEQLEQLCRDLWSDNCMVCRSEGWAIDENLKQRMNALGLLEVDE